MYNWINKELVVNQADKILGIDGFIPNAFLTIIMESDSTNFEKVVKWIESHQKEYNYNSSERALIGTDMIKLNALEQKEVLYFIKKHPSFEDMVISDKIR